MNNERVTAFKAHVGNLPQKTPMKGSEKKVGEKVTVMVPERVTVKVPEKVTANQNRILTEAAGNPRITAKELAFVAGISERKIKENTRKLKGKGLLHRVGPDRGGGPVRGGKIVCTM